MKNISFDNPRLLLLAIPALIIILIPFFISRNRDNRSIGWTVSLILHTLIVGLVAIALGGIMKETVLTKTSVYVVADLSHSTEGDLDRIDSYIDEIKSSLPEGASLGVVCFGRDTVIHVPLGKEIKSVKNVELDSSRTDISGALSFTAGLFKGDSLKRIILITDGLDTSGLGTSSVAGTVSRLSEDGIKIDAIFLDTSLGKDDTEVQVMGADYSSAVYKGQNSTVSLLVSSSQKTDAICKIEVKRANSDFTLLGEELISLDTGLTTHKINIPADSEGTFDYRLSVYAAEDFSEYNNTFTFNRTVKGEKNILLVTGNDRDEALIRVAYGDSATIDTRYIPGGDRAPVTLEEMLEYDEIIVSSLDVREIKNVNSFIDSLDKAVSAYGKSLITMGDLSLASDSDDKTFQKFEELLPLKFGSTGKDGRLYTIVLDVSHSMFMASKFTTAKSAAIRLLSVLEDDDYVCLVTFSGEITVKKPTKLRDCKDDLVEYISSLTTGHGTDIGLGLEEALKAVKALNLTENSVMLISDGFSFDSTRGAVEVSEELFKSGTPVSSVCTYIPSDGEAGRNTLKRVANAGTGGHYYEITTPERVEVVVFGQMAEDVGSYIIERPSTVNIARQKDAIVSGISSISSVSRYILSVAKYDATVPITVTYVKNNGYQETVPLYAYRAHGNGKISSFSTSLSDNSTELWSSEERSEIMRNLLESMTTKDIIDRPYTVNVERDDYSALITLTPSSPNPDATATLRITYPEGRSVSRTMVFDSSKYTFTIPTESAGAYRLSFTYTYGERIYTSEELFDISYTPEYNAFAPKDKFLVYEFMRGWGETLDGSIPSLELKEDEITTYKVSYRTPIIIVAIALFLIDIAVRTVRISKKTNGRKKKEA